MRKILANVAKPLVASVAVLAVNVAMAGNASAGTDGPIVRDTSGYKAEGIFLGYGEHFRVQDDYADGHSAVGRWRGPAYPEYRTCWDHDGADNGYADCDYSLPENTDVYYEICIGDYGSRTIYTSTCSSPAGYTRA